MRHWTTHYLNSRGSLSPYLKQISEAIDKVESKASKVIELTSLDIVIQAIENAVIPETGHCGYSPSAGLIYLTIDPANENLLSHLGEPLERVIAHELHHALRWDSVGYGRTLLEVLVTEGLASRFSQELYGNAPEIWESALSSEEVGQCLALAMSELASEQYNHSRWFFGSGDLPRWAGYTLGWHLIGNLTGNLSAKKPSELINTSAPEFKESLSRLAASYS